VLKLYITSAARATSILEMEDGEWKIDALRRNGYTYAGAFEIRYTKVHSCEGRKPGP